MCMNVSVPGLSFRLIVSAVAALFALSTAACTNSMEPDNTVVVTTRVSPTLVRAGDSVFVTVVIFNNELKAKLVGATRCFGGPFEVLDDDNNRVGPERHVCTLPLPVYGPGLGRVVLQPYDSVVIHDVWTGKASEGDTVIGPGNYTILSLVSSADGKKRFPGEPVKIRIVE